MSLQIWLPLVGDTVNRGLLNLSFTNTPASWGSGPLGASATFAGSTANCVYNTDKTVHYTDNFSWALWINTNYTGSTAQYAFTVGRADAGGLGYGLQCTSATACSVRFGNQVYSVAVTGGTWTHLAFSKEGTTLKIYKNGALYSTNTFSGTTPTYSDGYGLGVGAFHYASNIYPYYGSLCDFRIYDHVLSLKEVKELAKGLSIHLPLKGLPANQNLVPNSQTWNNSVSVGSTTRTTPIYDGVTIQRFTATKDITSGGVYTACFGGNRWNGGKYTWSMEIRGNTNFTIPQVGHERMGTQSVNVTTEWQKITRTGTYALTSYSAFIMYFSSTYPFANGNWFEIRNFKVEEGSQATPWVPNIYDTAYSSLGYGTLSLPYTLTGGPTNAQGSISGFATTKYINTGYTTPWNGASKWDMYLKFTTGTDVTTQQTLTNPVSGNSIALSIKSGYFCIILGSGSSWDILTTDTNTFAVSASTTYYVKISFTGSAYTVSHSTTSFDSVTQDYSLTSSTKIANDGSARIIGCNRAASFPFLGSIDMDAFAIYLNGNPTYLGKPSVGEKALIVDCTGYGRAVTASGKFYPVSDGPRGVATNFISGSKLTCSSGFPVGSQPPFTIAMWHRPTDNTYTAWTDVCGTDVGTSSSTSYGGFFRMETTGTAGTNYNWFGNGYVTTSGGVCSNTATIGTWRHMALTFDGTTFKQYVNGTLVNSSTLGSDYAGFKTYGKFYVGDTSGMFMDAADCRVYGTCLSADDVKALYSTPISIDKTGKLYCREIVEE